MSTLERALGVRRAAGLFRGADRGLIAVTGEDRTRWLQGMLSNDVASLAAGPEGSGCYAALLTPKGKIVTDLQVLLRADSFWLELAKDSLADVVQRLERYIIADDVTLSDQSRTYGRLGIEGPAAARILTSAGVKEFPTGVDAVVDTSLAVSSGGSSGRLDIALARFGWTGEEAFQLFFPAASEQAVASELLAAGSELGLIEAEAEVLEILRIEAGVPRLGRELSEDVMPDEARLARAVSLTKGCYTGQEIVARLHSRGQVNHLLVGLEFLAADSPESLAALASLEPGEEIWAQPPEAASDARPAPSATPARPARPARPIGRLTSICESPSAGRIGLAYVRRAQAEPGTRVRLAEQTARVVGLPFEAAEISGARPPASADLPPSGS